MSVDTTCADQVELPASVVSTPVVANENEKPKEFGEFKEPESPTARKFKKPVKTHEVDTKKYYKIVIDKYCNGKVDVAVTVDVHPKTGRATVQKCPKPEWIQSSNKEQTQKCEISYDNYSVF